MTREIAVWPPDADLDSFQWRISMATVTSGGPFSSFPGVDRILTVLAGALSLSIEDGAAVTLDSQAPPFGFPGDCPVSAEAPEADVTDLNVMTRRGQASASVERLQLRSERVIDAADWTLILPRTAALDVTVDDEVHGLSVDDAILITGADASVRCRPCAEVLITRINANRTAARISNV